MEACEFFQQDLHEWNCETHACLMVGMRSEPVTCAVAQAGAE